MAKIEINVPDTTLGALPLAQGETGRTDKFISQSTTLESRYGPYTLDPVTKKYCRTFYQKVKVTCQPGGPDDCLPATHELNGTDCMTL